VSLMVRQERTQCPIGLVPFEADGPNRPFLLPCNHNVSEEQLQLVCSYSTTAGTFACLQSLLLHQLCSVDAFALEFIIKLVV
jgi:hypothetical protein